MFLASYQCLVCVNYHSFGRDTAPGRTEEMNGDKRISVLEEAAMIGLFCGFHGTPWPLLRSGSALFFLRGCHVLSLTLFL